MADIADFGRPEQGVLRPLASAIPGAGIVAGVADAAAAVKDKPFVHAIRAFLLFRLWRDGVHKGNGAA